MIDSVPVVVRDVEHEDAHEGLAKRAGPHLPNSVKQLHKMIDRVEAEYRTAADPNQHVTDNVAIAEHDEAGQETEDDGDDELEHNAGDLDDPGQLDEG